MSHLQKVEEGPLICPICLDIPESHIFQCKNGHTICDSCSINLYLCPTCRVEFGEERIRNRALEDLIEGMEISCKHKEAGCAEKIIKRDSPAHLKLCKFRPINICKHLGYGGACNFASSKPSDLFQHLLAEHKLERTKRRSFTAPLKVFLDPLKYKQAGGDRIFKPFLRAVEVDSSCKVLEVVKVSAYKDEFSICYVHFGDADQEHCPYLAGFQITAPPKVAHVTWAARPVHVRELEETLVASLPLKISGRYMLKHMDQEGATVEVKFSKNK